MTENKKKKDRKLWQLAIMQVSAGGGAGFVEVCLMHPLDLVKTRLQLQSNVATPAAPQVRNISFPVII